MYILIKTNENGNQFSVIDDLDHLLNHPLEHGVTKFLDTMPGEDPDYWPEGHAMLLQATTVCPELVTVYRLPNRGKEITPSRN